MATKKTRKKTQTKNTRQSSSQQIYPVIWFTVALFLMCIVFIKGHNLWTALHNLMFGIFGVMAYVYPFLLGVVAVLFAMNKAGGSMNTKVIETIIIAVLIGGAIDIFAFYSPDLKFGEHLALAYTAGPKLQNGGFLGALIGHPLCVAFGKAGAAITVILLIFVFIMLMTGTTLIALFKAIKKPVQAVSEQAEQAYIARAEREKEQATATPKEKEKKKQLKVIKGFNVDIPVDEAEHQPEAKTEGLDEKQRKVVDTYYDDDESLLKTKKNDIPEGSGDKEVLQTALDVASEEASENQTAVEKIKVDFEAETARFTDDIAEEEKHKLINYSYPPTSLLASPTAGSKPMGSNEATATGEKLVEVLRSFGVETRVVDISHGPTVTRYELQPCTGVKISKITNLADDIALNLAASGVRIEAPIPNKAAVGIEVPNKSSAVVGVREIIESPTFTASKSKLTVALGRDIGGNVIITDISKMPHGLIAGATGSGKSVCINSIIMSILYKATPKEVKLLMIDPKVVELGVYNGIPHLLVPVVTDPKKASGALGWAVSEMEQRYAKFADRGVRDIEGYNRFVDTLTDEPEVEKLPHIVIIIDELADLMMTAPKEVEDSISRIAAKARAAGIHLLIATQRPSVDVITGVIKSNIPTRIAFAVSSHIDSRTILDTAGAEKLLGRGDMLFSPMGSNKPKRIQGCFVSEQEVERVVSFVKSGGSAEYDDNIMVEIERQAAIEKHNKTGLAEDAPEGDAMLDEAIRVVVENGQASTSLLQRRLKLGYARAARIIDEMEERGIVGPYEGAKPRKVLITKEQLMEREASEE